MTHVTVYFDPLCGWCYGATPTIRRLVAQPGLTVELVPTGLFAGAGARTMDDRMAAHAWTADQRIAQLTGQPFSERYRDQVLADRHTKLDSRPATIAVTAVALADPARELDALEAIQTARYVSGRDVTATAVLVDILDTLGLPAVAARIATPDVALVAATETRTTAARRAVHALGATGVPTLVVDGRLIASDGLYGRFDDLIRQIQPLPETNA